MDEIEVINFYTAYLPKEKILTLFDNSTGKRILSNYTGIVKNAGNQRLITMLDGAVHSFNDEPALIIMKDEYVLSRRWFCNGVFSRHTGPAVIFSDDYGFAIDGHTYAFDEFIKLSNATDEQKIEMLLKYS